METLQEKLRVAEEGGLKFRMVMDSHIWELLKGIVKLAMEDPIIASEPDGALYASYRQLHSLLVQHKNYLHLRPVGILLIKGAILLRTQTDANRFDVLMLSKVMDSVLYKMGFGEEEIKYLSEGGDE